MYRIEIQSNGENIPTTEGTKMASSKNSMACGYYLLERGTYDLASNKVYKTMAGARQSEVYKDRGADILNVDEYNECYRDNR